MSTTVLKAPGVGARAISPPRPDPVRWGPLLVVLAGTFVTILDFFIVNVAIPPIQRDLHAGSAAVQFVLAGYALTLAAGLITGGRLGDLYGRRRLFGLGLAAFTVASAACGLAPSSGALIAARVLQGAAAAALTPQVLAILGTVYTGPHRARAFAAYGLTLGLAGVFGQLIGGALIAANIAGLGWRSIFLVNVPIGVVALALTRRVVPESRDESSARLDLVSSALLTAALVAIVLPLIEGRQQGWPSWTWLSLTAAPLLVALFVAYQARLSAGGRAPLLNLELFKERAFSAGLATCLTFFLANGSFFLFLALYLQQGRGLSALDSGLVFIAVGIGFFAALLQAERVAAKLRRQILAVGSLTTGGGYALLAASVTHIGTSGSVAWLIPGLLITGFGLGLVLVPLTDIVLARITPRHAGAAAGVLATAQQLGGALGIAVIGVVYYGSLKGLQPASHAHAFTLSLAILTVFTIIAAALVQLLPSTTTAQSDSA
ncbi:MAG: MFS transporter [Solirubrobacteraceae bacterium]